MKHLGCLVIGRPETIHCKELCVVKGFHAKHSLLIAKFIFVFRVCFCLNIVKLCDSGTTNIFLFSG